MAFLEIKDVKKRYGGVDVLKGIDISINAGDFLVLVGPSGCGKSTLLNLIAGLDQLSEGEIWINGAMVNDLHPSKRDIAMVFQSYALYPNMTVAENIAFGLEMRGVPKAERESAVADVGKILKIEHLLKRKPSQLSGGQRQRVAMGRALVRKPQVFLFDEPLSNLDAKLRVEMRTEIKRLHQNMGATIVYVTHDQIEAMTLATQIAVMNAGEIQQLGSPKEIYNRPTNTFVASFMGSPSMNMIPATLANGGAGLSVKIESQNGAPVTLPLGKAVDATPGRPVILGLRPEAVTDPGAADRSSGAVTDAQCHVEVVEPAGSDTFAVTRLGGVEVIARMRADADLKPGQIAPFSFNMEKAVLFDPETGARIG
ncbi:MAG TPA: sn-glycerol-3-phosphate ABC transporter ATP-binding protein UgpC [Dongiaceae bacterium]|nr:sn-glycerol-3-phosphate ABC transporter ATP-binding protein UgpC [Dongiaceae bacterium]